MKQKALGGKNPGVRKETKKEKGLTVRDGVKRQRKTEEG